MPETCQTSKAQLTVQRLVELAYKENVITRAKEDIYILIIAFPVHRNHEKLNCLYKPLTKTMKKKNRAEEAQTQHWNTRWSCQVRGTISFESLDKHVHLLFYSLCTAAHSPQERQERGAVPHLNQVLIFSYLYLKEKTLIPVNNPAVGLGALKQD